MFRLIFLCVLIIGCGSKKRATTKNISIENIEKKEIVVKETIHAPFEAVYEIPEVAGRIENFTQKIELPTGGVFVEKTNTGLKISIEQAEIKYKDSITDISVFSDTKTDINNTKTVIKWSKFQWFLLLFFIAVVIIFLFRIFKFLS